MSTPPVVPNPSVQTVNSQTPDGLWNIATTTTTTFNTTTDTKVDVVITAIKPPPPPPPPIPQLLIPSTAKSSGILDNYPSWKAEKDAGTPGTVLPADTFNKYIDANNGRQFYAKQTGKAGMRWSTSFVKGQQAATNFVYDLYVKIVDPTQLGQLELDMNQMMSDGRNCFLCIQANFIAGVWDYTTTPNNSCHWTHSNIKINKADWLPNTWKHIRLKTSRDDAGVVTYEGVELDGVYTLFDPTCKGVSAFKQNWTPGVLINNYQTNGANASGILDTCAKQIQVFYW